MGYATNKKQNLGFSLPLLLKEVKCFPWQNNVQQCIKVASVTKQWQFINVRTKQGFFSFPKYGVREINKFM